MARKELTAEQRAALGERLKQAREARRRNREAAGVLDHETPAAAIETPEATVADSSQPLPPSPERQKPQPATEHETLQEPALERAALGRLAQALAGNAAVEEAFRRAITETIQMWENSPPDKPEMREFLYHDLRALRALKHQIGRVAHDGHMEQRFKDRLKAV